MATMTAMFDDKAATKDTVHNLLVALYLFPKFHECLTYNVWFIAGFSLIAQFKMAAKFEDKSATKDTVHNLLVAHYLFPKFHEMFDLYFLIYCMIQFYCAIQDGHHDGHVGRWIGNKRYYSQSPCCPLSISKVSWMYDQYFTSYCSINISDGRKDERTDGRRQNL